MRRKGRSSFWVPDQNVMTIIMCRREKGEGVAINEGWTENGQNSREKRPACVEGQSHGFGSNWEHIKFFDQMCRCC
jgi:hypothetical protein